MAKLPVVTVSLAQIRAASPCTSGYKKLCQHIEKKHADKYNHEDGEEFPLKIVLDSNGYIDYYWVLKNIVLNKQTRELNAKFARNCANHVKHLKNNHYVAGASSYAAYAAYDAYAYDDAAHASDVAHASSDAAYASSYAAHAYAYAYDASSDADAYDASYASYASDASYAAAPAAKRKEILWQLRMLAKLIHSAD